MSNLGAGAICLVVVLVAGLDFVACVLIVIGMVRVVGRPRSVGPPERRVVALEARLGQPERR